MSLNRYATRRDDNEPEIIQALKAQGCSVYQLDEPLDLLVGFTDNEGRRRTILMEVKRAGGPRGGKPGQLTLDQEQFLKHWKGDIASVVHSASEALALIGCESRGVEIGPRRTTSSWLDGNYDGGVQ